jgi:GNAT superfamily N-acetyltransferase
VISRKLSRDVALHAHPRGAEKDDDALVLETGDRSATGDLSVTALPWAGFDQLPKVGRPVLAVDRAYQNRGLGAGLLRDAILRTLQAAELGGIRAILVHAISAEAKRFYERHGFVESPADPMTLMITVADAKKALGSG